MYYFYNRGMEFVHCTEVVHLSESPLLEVSLYLNIFPALRVYVKIIGQLPSWAINTLH